MNFAPKFCRALIRYCFIVVYPYFFPSLLCTFELCARSAYDEGDRFCVLVKWDDFKKDPNSYIEKAFNKRSQPIADEVIVRPK